MHRALVLLAACTLLFAACTGGGAPTAGPAVPTVPPSAPTRVAATSAPADAVPGAGATSPAASPGPRHSLKVSYSVVSAGMSPVWVAADQGLWERHGLDVELVLISGTPNSMAALISGDVQVATTSGDSAMAFQQREPNITAILNTALTAAHRMIVVGDIQRPEDLRGKRLGVFTLGDGNQALISKALQKYNINPEREVIWTPVGGGNMGGFIGALAAGAIDAALLPPPTDLPAIKNGGRVLFHYGDLDLPYGGLPHYTLRRTLESQRPALEAYAAGVADAARLFKSDPAIGKAALEKWSSLTDAETLEWTYEAYRGARMSDRPFVDLAQMRAVQEALIVEQPELRDLQLERVIDHSVLAALEQRGYFDQR